MPDESVNRRIVRQDLHAEVLSILRDHINSGRFRPQERLNERELCGELGISRTPLREAFKVLASEGFVTLLPNRGAVVSPLSIEEFDAVVDVMAHLELLIGQCAGAVADDLAIARVTAWHEEMERCFRQHEQSGYFQLNQKIHLEFARLSGNPVLENVYSTLNGRLKRYRYQANSNAARWRQAMEEHEAILEAFTCKDGTLLGKLLRQHLMNKAASVRREF